MIRNLAVGWSQYQKKNETGETKVRLCLGKHLSLLLKDLISKFSPYLTLADEDTASINPENE